MRWIWQSTRVYAGGLPDPPKPLTRFAGRCWDKSAVGVMNARIALVACRQCLGDVAGPPARQPASPPARQPAGPSARRLASPGYWARPGNGWDLEPQRAALTHAACMVLAARVRSRESGTAAKFTYEATTSSS